MDAPTSQSGRTDQARLAQARARFFEHSLDLVCLANPDAFFEDVNGSWTRTLGWSREQLLARPYVEFVHPDDVEATNEAAKALVDGETVVQFTNRYRHADGGWVWLEWAARLEPDLQLVFAIARDVTRERELKHSLSTALDELQARAELRDHFIATASHELRTPVTAIAGFSATMRDRWDDLDEPQLRRFVEIIDGQSTRLLRVVDGLLSMARIDAGVVRADLGPVDVCDALSEAAGLAGDVPVEVRCAADQFALADRGLLDQVLMNLVTNATHYGRPPIELQGEVDAEADVIRIRVVDHGDGVPEAFRPYLFDKFTQAQRVLTEPVHGTGLGLSITEALVHAMGGQIGYEPHCGGGACFIVDLPACSAPGA
jgi:PAS domain S-box-containing protein